MKGFLKNSSIFIGGELLAKLVPFLMLPYLTRVLSTDDFGQLGLFTSLLALALICVNLSYEGAIARYFYRYGNKNFPKLILVSFLLVMTSGLFLLTMSAALLPDNKIWQYAVIVGMLQAFFNILLTSKQCQKKALSYIFYQILYSVLSALATVALFKAFEYTLDIRILAIALSLTVVLLLSCALNLRLFDLKITLKQFKLNYLYLFSFGLPLVIHQISLFIRGQLDRIIIAHSFTVSDLAYYTAAFQLASVISVGIMAVNKAIVPYYYELCKKGIIDLKVIKKTLVVLGGFCFIISGLVWIIPSVVYGFILGAKYSDIGGLVLLFTIAFSLQIPYLAVVNYLFYKNDNKVVASITFVSSILHVFLLLILRNFTIELIPLAMIVSNLFSVILLYLRASKKFA